MLQFILVANDAYSATGSTISAYQIANERLKRAMWPIYKGTRNRMAITASDRILVYLEGIEEFSQTFVAHAEVETLEEVGRHVISLDPGRHSDADGASIQSATDEECRAPASACRNPSNQKPILASCQNPIDGELRSNGWAANG